MDPFLSEIRIFPFNYAPYGWAFCSGQLMAIAQNTALFSLLGTTYGGDGRVTFGLPNLPNRVPRGAGDGPGLTPVNLGEAGGTPSVTLRPQEVPQHNHDFRVSDQDGEGDIPGPQRILGRSLGGFAYQSQGQSLAQMNYASLAPVGASGPHNNMQPYLTLNFCIALQGVYPQRP
jgi:microcystin-dependent protein